MKTLTKTLWHCQSSLPCNCRFAARWVAFHEDHAWRHASDLHSNSTNALLTWCQVGNACSSISVLKIIYAVPATPWARGAHVQAWGSHGPEVGRVVNANPPRRGLPCKALAWSGCGAVGIASSGISNLRTQHRVGASLWIKLGLRLLHRFPVGFAYPFGSSHRRIIRSVDRKPSRTESRTAYQRPTAGLGHGSVGLSLLGSSKKPGLDHWESCVRTG